MDNCQDLISVLLPVYKPDFGLLAKAVGSVLGQDYKNLEVVIVEDPSDRLGREVIEGFSDRRIRYKLNDTRTSMIDQLNTGIGLSRGEYIARMDADDISMPSRLGQQLEFLREHPDISVVGTNIEIINEKGVSLGYRRLPERHEEIVRALRLYCSVAHPTVMFRKAAVIAEGLYQVSAPVEDWDLWCRLYKSGKKFHNIQEPLFKYRIHSQAGKITTMRKTLLAGIALKKRHFKNGIERWGFREDARCATERILMFLPPKIVLKLFLYHSLRKEP